jgi:hypothetical protein
MMLTASITFLVVARTATKVLAAHTPQEGEQTLHPKLAQSDVLLSFGLMALSVGLHLSLAYRFQLRLLAHVAYISTAFVILASVVLSLTTCRAHLNRKTGLSLYLSGAFILTLIVVSLITILCLLPGHPGIEELLLVLHFFCFASVGVFFILRGAFWITTVRRLYPKPKPVPLAQGAYAGAGQSYGRHPAMVMPLGGGAKFGYFALGFVLGVIGLFIAWLVNKDNPNVKTAVKFSVIGLAIPTALALIGTIALVIIGAVAG